MTMQRCAQINGRIIEKPLVAGPWHLEIAGVAFDAGLVHSNAEKSLKDFDLIEITTGQMIVNFKSSAKRIDGLLKATEKAIDARLGGVSDKELLAEYFRHGLEHRKLPA